MKKSKLKTLAIIVSVFCVMFFFYLFGWLMSPGSYALAETYNFNVSEDDLIRTINQIKIENKNLDFKFFEDGRDKFWYSIYFKDEENKRIYHTWTRPCNDSVTTFAFASYKANKPSAKWIQANEYFWWWKNTKSKNEFEELILSKIKAKLN